MVVCLLDSEGVVHKEEETVAQVQVLPQQSHEKNALYQREDQDVQEVKCAMGLTKIISE